MNKIKFHEKEKARRGHAPYGAWRGFTLIELLIAMTILLICILFITPVFIDTLKTYTASTEQMTRLRNLSNLMQLVTNDLKTSKLTIKSPATPFVPNPLSPTAIPIALEISVNDTGGKEYVGYKFDNVKNKVYKLTYSDSCLATILRSQLIADYIYNVKFGIYGVGSNPTYMDIYAETKTTKNKLYNIQNRIYMHNNI